MKDLHKFLNDHLAGHQKRIRDLAQHSESVARTLLSARDADGIPDHWYWPYSCRVENDVITPTYPEPSKASTSTQAMICASIDRILLKDSDHKILRDDERKNLMQAQHQVEEKVLTILKKNIGKMPFLESKTFGDDDIFTASWLLQMYRDQKEWDETEKAKWWAPEIKKALVGAIAERIVRKVDAIELIDYDRGLFVFEQGKRENEAGPHSLPLLKVIQALEIIEADPSLKEHWDRRFARKDKPIANAIWLAGDWLEKNLHRQMSFYQFKDFRFDAAELIFCLHGSIKTGKITAYESIIDNVLEVVREAQKRSVYWRPYRPMTSSSQGGVLLPLSIEVAMALLKTLQETKKFVKYADTLEEYFKWLYSQRLIPSDHKEGQAPAWVGWHSENAYEFKVIHIWDTALVGAFLAELLEAKDDGFQEQILDAGSFTFERAEDIDMDLEPLETMISPDQGLQPDTTKAMLLEKFNWRKGSSPDKFSLLVFGPPGSSKTTLAKSIAKSLGWPLVYLSPSNFITSGEAGIEQQAKDIFDALVCLRKKLIFFDEIDRLIVDRDSHAYTQQTDMFQFMTPSMLTKINDLRRAKRSVFIIATNYEERIDKAIKRKGRIDESIAWLPMDLQARTEQFKKFIDESFTDRSTTEVWSDKAVKELRAFSKRCVLRIYPELKECFEKGKRPAATKTLQEFRMDYVKILSTLKDEDIPAPEVSLEVYKSRTTKKSNPNKSDDYVQGPYLEYACLLLILGESGANGDVKKDFEDLIDRWRDGDSEDFKKKWPEVERRVKAYGLETWIQGMEH